MSDGSSIYCIAFALKNFVLNLWKCLQQLFCSELLYLFAPRCFLRSSPFLFLSRHQGHNNSLMQLCPSSYLLLPSLRGRRNSLPIQWCPSSMTYLYCVVSSGARRYSTNTIMSLECELAFLFLDYDFLFSSHLLQCSRGQQNTPLKYTYQVCPRARRGGFLWPRAAQSASEIIEKWVKGKLVLCMKLLQL